MKKIEYLDLDLNNYNNHRLNIDKNRFCCSFEGTFTHQLHGEHIFQLNSIIDHQINFVENIKKYVDKINNLINLFIDHLRNTHSIIKE